MGTEKAAPKAGQPTAESAEGSAASSKAPLKIRVARTEDAPAIARDNYAIWRLMIDQRFQGKGYGYEACRAVLEYAEQEIGLSEIFVCMDKNNNPSRNLALKLGFESYATDVDGFDIYHIYLKLPH